MRFYRLTRNLPLVLLALAALVTSGHFAAAQSVVALVNGDPISTFDVAQRQRWLARANGFGERMKSALGSESTKQRFYQLLKDAKPRSQAEAQQMAEGVKKRLLEETKQRVLNEAASSTRKAAIEALVDDLLKLQAAKKLGVTVDEAEVEGSLTRGVPAGEAKAKLAEIYQQYEADGISRKTILSVIRAQLAWRDVIRRQYGPRIQSLLAASSEPDKKASEGDVQFDVRVLRLAVSEAGDDRAVGQRILEAENLKSKFVSCAELPKQAKLVSGSSVSAMDKAKLAAFPKDVQPLLVKATEGQMTPPMSVGNAVESYAVCKKSVAVKAQPKADEKADVRQQEFERFSRQYLRELKQAALIDIRGG